MNVFLEELAKYLGDRRIILIIDSASWHKSCSMKIPVNISLIHLPPYSPELNPIERLWLYIKNHVIKNRIYNTIGDLENALSTFIINMDVKTVLSICKINYLPNYM